MREGGSQRQGVRNGVRVRVREVDVNGGCEEKYGM